MAEFISHIKVEDSTTEDQDQSMQLEIEDCSDNVKEEHETGSEVPQMQLELQNSSLQLDNIKEEDEADEYQGDYYFICGTCRQWFSTKSSLVIHIGGHFQECSACESCGEVFTEASDYADHCAKHVGYTCLACAETFIGETNFANHFLQHKLNCIFCKQTFSSEEDLQIHYAEHSNSVNHKCDLCHGYYSSKRSLRYHKYKQHRARTKLFECKICHEKFSESGSRNRHYRVTHKNIKDFVCKLCGKEYTCKSSLMTHLLNHAGKKPYVCLVCGRSYADKKQFKVHGKEHLASESDPCQICGKVFASDRKLKTHLLIHENAGTYQCDICIRSFNCNSNYKRHLISHSNVKPEVCEVCGKGFEQKCKLKKHLRQKHHFPEEKLEDTMRRLKYGIATTLDDTW